MNLFQPLAHPQTQAMNLRTNCIGLPFTAAMVPTQGHVWSLGMSEEHLQAHLQGEVVTVRTMPGHMRLPSHQPVLSSLP